MNSKFVTTTAWTAIVLSTVAGLLFLIQVLGLRAISDTPEYFAAMEQVEVMLETMPPGVHYMFDHYESIALGSAAACLVALIASIGMLKRRNWGRYGFVALLVAHIVLNIGALFVAFDPLLGTLTVVLSASLGILAWKLLTPEVAAEFR